MLFSCWQYTSASEYLIIEGENNINYTTITDWFSLTVVLILANRSCGPL